jgi:leucyl aminopeptidase
MKVHVESGLIEKHKAEVVCVSLFEDLKVEGFAKKLDIALKGKISKIIHAKDFKGEAAEIFLFSTEGKIPAKRVLLTGLGKRKEFELDTIRMYAVAARRSHSRNI